MALGDLVTEQGKQIATLTARLDRAAEDLDAVELAIKDSHKEIHQIDKRIVAVESQIAELKRAIEETDRRRWTLVLAAIGVMLTFVGNIIFSLIRR